MSEKLQKFKEADQHRMLLIRQIMDAQKEAAALEKTVFSLSIEVNNREYDVAMLKRFSIRNVFYGLTGKKEVLLEEKTRLARHAVDQLGQTRFRIEQLKRRMDADRAALLHCSDSSVVYLRALLTEKALMSGNPDIQKEIDGIREELEGLLQLLDSIGQQILIARESIDNTRKWNYSLAGNAWNLSVPGYLGGVQKRLETVKDFMQELALRLCGHTIPCPDAENLFPKVRFREIASKPGAEERLLEAKNELQELEASVSGLRIRIQHRLNEME